MIKTVLSLFLILITSPAADANMQILKQFKTQYPNSKKLFKCLACHTQGAELNFYGKDLQLSNFNFTEIETLDSDNDTFSNILEIEAETFPGDEASVPPQN